VPSPFDAMYQDPVATPPNPKGPRWEDPDVAARGFGDMSGDEQMAEIERANALSNAVNAFEEEENAAALQGVRAPSQFDVAGVAGMRGGKAGSDADSWAKLLMAGGNTPSHANPLHPIRQEFRDTMLGDGSPQHAIGPDGQPMYETRMVEEPVVGADGKPMIDPTNPSGPPLTRMVEKQIPIMEANRGLIGQEEYQTQDLHAAQIGEQMAHANAYAQEAGRQQARIDVMEQKALRDAQRQQDAIKASQLVMSKVSEAADRLNESPDIDPNRYWASQSAGRKAGWAISAGLLGFAGLNPFGALQQAISNDIDAQKANFAQKQAGFAARQGELDSSRSVYQDIRTAIGDEQATDLMMEQARLAQAETAFKAMAVKEGIPPAIAANNLFLTQLQQRNAEITKTLGEMMAKTPERIGGGWKPLLRGPQRTIAMKEYERAAGRADAFDTLAITQGGAAAHDAAAIEAERVKAGVKSEETSKLEYQQRKDYVKDTAPLVEEIRQIKKYKEDYANDIPGFGELGWLGRADMTDAQQSAYRRLVRIVLLRLRPESGAAISDSEIERESGGMIGGEKNEKASMIAEAKESLRNMDEADVRAMLDERLEEAQSRLDYFGRPQDEPEVERVHRGRIAPRAAISGGGGVHQPDVVRRR